MNPYHFIETLKEWTPVELLEIVICQIVFLVYAVTNTLIIKKFLKIINKKNSPTYTNILKLSYYCFLYVVNINYYPHDLSD